MTLIAHITDLHISADHRDGPCSPNDRAAAIVAHLNASPHPVDVVVVTGDVVDTNDRQSYRLARRILDPLRFPVICIPGNHDMVDLFADTFPGARGPLGDCCRVADVATPRFVIVDTTIPDEVIGRLDDRRLGWLDTELAAMPDTPTFVLMHHPPVKTGSDAMDALGLLEGGERFADVMARHDHIVAVLCGHAHRPIVAMIGRIPIFVGAGVAVAFGLQFGPGPVRPVAEPYGYFLHSHSPGLAGLSSHMVFVELCSVERAG
jgi:3',5'-cyclic-AMP phosphodiesterase